MVIKLTSTYGYKTDLDLVVSPAHHLADGGRLRLDPGTLVRQLLLALADRREEAATLTLQQLVTAADRSVQRRR